MKKQRNMFPKKEQAKIWETDLNKPEIKYLPYWVQNNGYKVTHQKQESNGWTQWEIQHRDQKYQKVWNREITEVKNTMLNGETEALILWPDANSQLTGKDPDARKDWGQEEKGPTEDEIVGWHHCLNGHESEQAPGVGDGQGSLACCSPWGHKESDMTEWLNNNNKEYNSWTETFNRGVQQQSIKDFCIYSALRLVCNFFLL